MIFYPGRAFVSYMISLSSSVSKLHHYFNVFCVVLNVAKEILHIPDCPSPSTSSVWFVICLHSGVFAPTLDLTLQCMCSLAFFGFLRCGEFTIKSLSNDSDSCLKCKDVSFASDNYVLSYPTHFKNGIQGGCGYIPIYRNNSSVTVKHVRCHWWSDIWVYVDLARIHPSLSHHCSLRRKVDLLLDQSFGLCETSVMQPRLWREHV